MPARKMTGVVKDKQTNIVSGSSASLSEEMENYQEPETGAPSMERKPAKEKSTSPGKRCDCPFGKRCHCRACRFGCSLPSSTG